MVPDPASCEALRGWADAANNGWTGAGTASDYAAFAGVAAGLTLAVLVVALQAPRPEGVSARQRDQRLREQTMAVGVSTVLVLIGTSFLFAQATGESTCAARNIDITVVGAPLGAGVVGIFVLTCFISDLLGLAGIASRVTGWCLLWMASLAMLMNAWSSAYVVGMFRDEELWTEVPRLIVIGLAMVAYWAIYRRSLRSTRNRDQIVLGFAAFSLALTLGAVGAYVVAGLRDYQADPKAFPVWLGVAIGAVSIAHGALALAAAPLSQAAQGDAETTGPDGDSIDDDEGASLGGS